MKRKKELKEYIQELSTKILNGCKLFTDVYGKNFAQESIMHNLKEVRTDGEITGGSYDTFSKVLNISVAGKSIKPNDIKRSPILKRIGLHEAVHAVFRRSSKECAEYEGISGGTGIYIMFENGQQLGIGLNEGYNNWVLEKAGIKMMNYPRLTNIMRILEMAVGEKNVMALRKENPIKSIPKQLKMERNEAMSILSLTDEIYLQEKEIEFITEAINTLIYYKHIDELDTDKRSQIEEAYIELEKDKRYTDILDDTLQDDEEKIEHLREIKQREEADTKKTTARVLERLFVKYFRSEIEEGLQLDHIPHSKMERFQRLNELFLGTIKIDTVPIDDKARKKRSPLCAGRETAKFLKSSYKQLSKKYVMDAMSEEASVIEGEKRSIFEKKIRDMPGYSEGIKKDDISVYNGKAEINVGQEEIDRS